MREWLGQPGVNRRLVSPRFHGRQALPGYSPDFNADEAIWGWAREEATGNLCLGTKAKVAEKVGNFLAGLDGRKDEVRRRCRTILQSRAEALPRKSRPDSQHQPNAHPTLALVQVLFPTNLRCNTSPWIDLNDEMVPAILEF